MPSPALIPSMRHHCAEPDLCVTVFTLPADVSSEWPSLLLSPASSHLIANFGLRCFSDVILTLP